MRRRRATLPTTQAQPASQPATQERDDLGARRARAMERAYPLLVTSIPTRDVLDSYLNAVLTEA
jgi:hypothetical protein